MIDSGRDRDLVAEVSRELDYTDASVMLREFQELSVRPIVAAVIDENDFVLKAVERSQGF